MNWVALAIALFMFLFLMEVGIQIFLNFGRHKQDGFLKTKIKEYKKRKAQKAKNSEVPM